MPDSGRTRLLPAPDPPPHRPCHSQCLSPRQAGPALGGSCQPGHRHCQPAGPFSSQNKPNTQMSPYTEGCGVGTQAGAHAPCTWKQQQRRSGVGAGSAPRPFPALTLLPPIPQPGWALPPPHPSVREVSSAAQTRQSLGCVIRQHRSGQQGGGLCEQT